jgi:RES domain-containing protein
VRAYRIFERKHAATALSGEGARLYGGRWNSPGTSVVYTSTSFALALLEMLVNVRIVLAPPDTAYVSIDVPDDATVETLDAVGLPSDWFDYPAPADCQNIGDAWVLRGTSLGLLVPSAVARIEHNLLLNPAHADFRRLRVGDIENAPIDARLLGR